MSYDITIGDEEFNYTYNLARFFHAVIEHENKDGNIYTGLNALHGLTGRQAISVLEEALRVCVAESYSRGRDSFLKLYDADNGWGDTYGATLLLGLMIAACSRNKKAIIEVF